MNHEGEAKDRRPMNIRQSLLPPSVLLYQWVGLGTTPKQEHKIVLPVLRLLWQNMKSKQGGVVGKWRGNYDYEVDYNDHFETPRIAYEDLLTLLDAVARSGKARKDHVLYDPYYCNGRTAKLLHELGFDHVVHEKRDFYEDIANGRVPNHDTLITNPPYSDKHKEQCLEICIRQFEEHHRPFFILMPNYVASRSYFRQILGDHLNDMVYLIPSQPYEYDHPEGTGHQISPFSSLWFCGVGRDKLPLIRETWQKLLQSEDVSNIATLVTSFAELQASRAIPTEKRPNPRQRKKMKAKIAGDTMRPINPLVQTNSQGIDKTHKLTKGKNKTKSSRYRDSKGNRTKKRF